MADVELVIKIPEEIYESCRKECSENLIVDAPTYAVAKGTPLPKGHGKLGDLDELMNRIGLEDNADNREENVGEIVTLEDIDSVATIVEADKGEQI